MKERKVLRAIYFSIRERKRDKIGRLEKQLASKEDYITVKDLRITNLTNELTQLRKPKKRVSYD